MGLNASPVVRSMIVDADSWQWYHFLVAILPILGLVLFAGWLMDTMTWCCPKCGKPGFDRQCRRAHTDDC